MSRNPRGVNRNVPQMPQPVADVGSLLYAANAFKQALDSLSGYRGGPLARAVTFQDLVDLGLVSNSIVVNEGATTNFATTAFVDEAVGAIGNLSAEDLTNGVTGTGKIVLQTSPELTGEPVAPTAVPGTDTDQVATTAFVADAIATSAGITDLTGDVTATGPGSAAATLGTVNSDVGSFGSSSAIPSFTVNAKGLITGASESSILAASGMLPLVNGDLPGPSLISDGAGQCIGVPL